MEEWVVGLQVEFDGVLALARKGGGELLQPSYGFESCIDVPDGSWVFEGSETREVVGFEGDGVDWSLGGQGRRRRESQVVHLCSLVALSSEKSEYLSSNTTSPLPLFPSSHVSSPMSALNRTLEFKEAVQAKEQAYPPAKRPRQKFGVKRDEREDTWTRQAEQVVRFSLL
jgi:hypothetical protein